MRPVLVIVVAWAIVIGPVSLDVAAWAVIDLLRDRCPGHGHGADPAIDPHQLNAARISPSSAAATARPKRVQELQPKVSNRSLAKALGVDEATVRRDATNGGA